MEQPNEIKEEQTNIQTEEWLKEEAEELKKECFDGEKIPALKLEENKISKIDVDFSLPFRTWTSPEGIIKKLIPVLHKGEKKIFWLNVRNPLYKELIERGQKGEIQFNILQTGTQKNTKYSIVEGE